MIRIFGLVLFLLGLTRFNVCAQTVESVLRALQERQQMILTAEFMGRRLEAELKGKLEGKPADYSGITFSTGKLIKWPGISKAFPADGDLTDLDDVLGALNVASLAFDEIKTKYLAYDVQWQQFVNAKSWAVKVPEVSRYDLGGNDLNEGRCAPASLSLPSVGDFSESNWRAKIKVLASNIGQLRSLPWPQAAIDASIYGSGDLGQIYATPKNRHTSKSVYNPSFESVLDFPFPPLSFPFFTNPGKKDDEHWDDGQRTNDWDDSDGVDASYCKVVLASSLSSNTSKYYQVTGVPEAFLGSLRAFSWLSETGYLEKQLASPVWDDPGPYKAIAGRMKVTSEVAAVVFAQVEPPVSELASGGATPIDGKLDWAKYAVPTDFGDLTEGRGREKPTDFPLSAFKVFSQKSSELISNQSIFAAPFDAYSTYIDVEGVANPLPYLRYTTAVSAAVGALGFSLPTGEWKPIAASAGWSGNYYEFSGANGIIPKEKVLEGELAPWPFPDGDWFTWVPCPTFKTKIHWCKLDTFLVCTPDFTPFDTTAFKKESLVPWSVAEVTARLGTDLVRISLGRSESDLNQVAWLGTRDDAFGSMIFHGSPNAFDVRYETDINNFEAPIGGATARWLDSSAANITGAGWKSRFEYMMAWRAPRLRQVRGGDAVVDIKYEHSYKKTISFYWPSDVGPADSSGFFSVSGATPFKTIVLSNPTASAGTVPTDQFHIKVEESDGRGREVVLTKTLDADQGLAKEVLNIDEGSTANSSLKTRKYTIDWGLNADGWRLAKSPIKLTETLTGESSLDQGSSTITSTEEMEFEEGLSAREVETPILKKHKITRNGETREMSLTWQHAPGKDFKPSEFELTNITWSGQNWDQNGNEVVFGGRGLVTSNKTYLGGKPHIISGSLSGNQRKTSYKLNGTDYRTETITYGSGGDGGLFTEEKISRGDEVVETRRYASGGGASGQPWSYLGSDYPSGYKTTVNYQPETTGASTTVTGSWGATGSASREEVLVTNRHGGLRSWTKKEMGILVDSATVLPADTTKWGAPKKVTSLRGEVSGATYRESGIAARALDTSTSPIGKTRTFSGYDWLLRPTTINTGFETLTFDRGNPLTTNTVSDAGPVDTSSVNAFGEFKSTSSTFGGGSSFIFNPGGDSTLTVDGRSVTMATDATGIVSSVTNGALSRGGAFSFGVEEGMLFTKEIENMKNGTPSANSVQTFYDARGRVKRVKRLANNGNTVTDSWEYDDVARSVTYTPGVGPVVGTVKTTLSADGLTQTIQKDGKDHLREVRSINGGALMIVTELFDDTGGEEAGWKEISRREIDPAAGTTTTTPFNIAGNAATVTQSPASVNATRTVANGASGDTLTTKFINGIPSEVNGTSGGIEVDLNITSLNGLVNEVSGTVGGLATGLKINAERRISEITSPGSEKTFTYGNVGGGLQLEISDSVQGGDGSGLLTLDSTGDATSIVTPGELPLSLNFNADGSERTINGELKLSMSPLNAVIAKKYAGGANGGIEESYTLNSDGSLAGFSVSGTAGSISATVTQQPKRREVSYFGGPTFLERYYDAGPRKDVSGPGDARSFTYERLSLKTEAHTAGPWSGWKVERLQDARGRLGTLRIKLDTGTVVREFGFGYDAHSRLSSSTTPQVNATYGARDAQGNLSTLTRGNLITTWSHDLTTGLLSAVEHDSSGSGDDYLYSFPEYDAQRRITKRDALPGVSWSNLTYGSHGELTGGHLNSGRNVAYGYTERGTRETQGQLVNQTREVQHVVNGLDQVTKRTLSRRGIGLFGSADKKAKVLVLNPLVPNWQTIKEANSVKEDFFAWWDVDVPQLYKGGAAAVIGNRVRGVLESTNPGGRPAIAEANIDLVLPPVVENLAYDGAGRLKVDAFWTYTWDNASRLTMMARHTALPADVQSETITFGYDADNRRTSKVHTITSTNTAVTVRKSELLWDGCLPVLEVRSKNGVVQDRRWFQWGADVSGTREGAGGIGGLVAVIEETGPGALKRVLLPVQDGLGNVTAVLDAANGATVARYEYGPFGEPLGGSGQTDACPFQWQTRWFDEESQHYCFPERYYNPRLGRWLSRDPLGEAGGFNLYAYCGNDPVNRHDPLGLSDAPFSPDVMDENQALALRNAPTFWESIILNAKAAQLNAWLDQQGGEIADTQDSIAAATTALRALDDEGQAYRRSAALSPFTANMSGSANYAQLTEEWSKIANFRDAQTANLHRLVGESSSWFDERGELIGDLDGSGRIDSLAEVNGRFTRVIGSGMKDQTSTLMDVGGAAMLIRVLPKALISVGRNAIAKGGTRLKRFFYDTRNFKREISPEYWAANGPADGRSLHHWLIPQRARWAPEGIRNGGWNLIELPAFEGAFHRSLGLNEWMGFAINWGPRHAARARLVEWSIRAGIPAAAGGAAYGGYRVGNKIGEKIWGEPQ